MLKLISFADSQAGNVRKKNEDAYLSDPRAGLFIVCDGVGGSAQGDVASHKAIEVIQDTFAENRSVLQKYQKEKNHKTRNALTYLVEHSIRTANRVIHELAKTNLDGKVMATTCDVLLLLDDFAFLGHVGDGRIYLIRSEKINCLTEDHSALNEMVKQGFSKEEALNSPYAQTITRAVGSQPYLQVDSLALELMEGDSFLICSDGLHHYMKLDTCLEKLKTSTVESFTKWAVKDALTQGGKDNLTLISVQVEKIQQDEQHVHVNAAQKQQVFSNIPLFKYLNHLEVTKLLSLTTTKEFEVGKTMIKEGDPGKEIFVLLSGQVSIYKGKHKITERGKGEIIGEMAILDNSPRSASVQVSQKLTALVLPQNDLFNLMKKEPVLAVKLMWAFSQSLNQRLRTTSDQLVSAKNSLDQIK